MNDKTLRNLSYGLFVLTTELDGRHNGCIINTAQQAGSDPLSLTIAVNKENLTHDMILSSHKFNVSIISEAASFDLFRRFGFQSGRDADKFAGFDAVKRSGNGLYYITEGTNGFFSAWVTDTMDLGSHTLFIATVTDMDVLSRDPFATYAYYHSNIKPAPAAKTSAKTVWRCSVCSYEYEGEELPADFTCPLCKHPASDFEKIS